MSSVLNSALKGSRMPVQETAIPKPYNPVESTARGISNIFIGVSECLVGTCMKCCQTHKGKQSQAHLERGWEDLHQGIKETTPAAIATAVLAGAASTVGITPMILFALSVGTGYAIHLHIKSFQLLANTKPTP